MIAAGHRQAVLVRRPVDLARAERRRRRRAVRGSGSTDHRRHRREVDARGRRRPCRARRRCGRRRGPRAARPRSRAKPSPAITSPTSAAPDDRRGPLVDHRVVDRAGLVVAVVGGADRLTLQARAQPREFLGSNCCHFIHPPVSKLPRLYAVAAAAQNRRAGRRAVERGGATGAVGGRAPRSGLGLAHHAGRGLDSRPAPRASAQPGPPGRGASSSRGSPPPCAPGRSSCAPPRSSRARPRGGSPCDRSGSRQARRPW